MAPLASALAVVGVGVAVALAKGQLERRADRAKGAPRGRPRDRRPALLAGEPFAEGLRRVILGQLDLAIELVESYPAERVAQPAVGRLAETGTDWGDTHSARIPTSASAEGECPPASVGPLVFGQTGERTVHETRKALKRLRALLTLLRAELGAKRYARENAALRACGRRLAGARDAEVMLGTLDSIVRRDPSHFTRSAAVRTLRAQLLTERDTATAHAINDPRVRGDVVIELRAVRARVERWELRERGFKLLAPGLESIYRRGRGSMRIARRRAAAERPGEERRRGKHSRRAGAGRHAGWDQSVEALHVWRKRVKELRYAAETLDRGGKRYKPVRRVARRADRLGEMLGEEHDLALLEVRVRERSRQFAGERKVRKRLLRLIAARRRKLRKRALREGERLYRRRPRRLVRRMRRTR